MKYILKKFDELTAHEVYEILKLRSAVFVVEQDCLYLDMDNKDYKCMHLYIFDEEQHDIVAYCRILPKGLTFETASLGRVITNKKYRRQNHARNLVKHAIQTIKDELQENVITIRAQSYLKEFYESLGFKQISQTYKEDEIPHIDMRLEL